MSNYRRISRLIPIACRNSEHNAWVLITNWGGRPPWNYIIHLPRRRLLVRYFRVRQPSVSTALARSCERLCLYFVDRRDSRPRLPTLTCGHFDLGTWKSADSFDKKFACTLSFFRNVFGLNLVNVKLTVIIVCSFVYGATWGRVILT